MMMLLVVFMHSLVYFSVYALDSVVSCHLYIQKSNGILVGNGYYSNRSDFIIQALREGLQKHQTTLDRMIDRHTKEASPHSWFLGVCSMGKHEWEEAKAQRQVLTYTGYGVLVIDKDIDTELLFRVVQSIQVKGSVICAQSVKDHYKLK